MDGTGTQTAGAVREEIDDLHFVPRGPQPLRVLAIEAHALLPRLLARLPAARVTAVTRFDGLGLPASLAGRVSLVHADTRVQAPPLPKGSYDIILAPHALTEALDPYDTLLALSRLLTDVGRLATAFLNVRCCDVLAGLQAGEFPFRTQRLYAKAEVVRLLNDALFKEITFAPGAQAAAPRGAAFRACGFDDTSHDLTTRVWLVRADRSTGAVAALKSLYTQETRAELARVLHRIEYGVRAEENIERLQALCTREGIFRDYLEDFVREVVTHPARLSGIIERLRLT